MGVNLVNKRGREMCKNKIQFQQGYSLPELFKHYGTPEQCEQSLFNLKWPEGFVCPVCESKSSCRLKSRKIYQCNHCHHQTSLTSGTIFESTKLPLNIWFMAIHLLTQSKTSVSALELQRQLGVSYNTAWSIKHKIMQVMKERDDTIKLSGLIQIDDVYWGGEHRGGKRGRGSENKTGFVAAVCTNEEGHPLYMNLSVVKRFSNDEIKHWSQKHLASGSQVISDGLACFNAVKEAGCSHKKLVTGGGPECVEIEEFRWVNTMISNVKTALGGTCHAVRAKHLPRYLAEFCYRFNRRFKLRDMLKRFVYVAARTPAMPKRLLTMAEP
jgi:transposase-like protein